MRLLEAASFFPTGPPRFRDYFETSVPEYAILSHRWGDYEVTYQEIADEKSFWVDRVYNKEGYIKIQNTARRALEYNIQWVWCDTCCIDKRSSAELTEAINSMYKWYGDSKYCFVFLNDWPSPRLSAFTDSVWFTRCWTLQELIAPKKLVFFNRGWELMDNKGNLADQISERTGIDKRIFLGTMPLGYFSIAQRMSWAAGRIATRSEDVAYCLLGIFDVNMPMLYGEGHKAFIRLQEEIAKREADQSIFAWSSSRPSHNLFASFPDDFASSGHVRPGNARQRIKSNKAFTVNNLGLEIELNMRQISYNTYAADLDCEVEVGADRFPVSLILEYDPTSMCFWRVNSYSKPPVEQSTRTTRRSRRLIILRCVPDGFHFPDNLYGFRLGGQCRSLVLINDWDPRHYWDTGKWERGIPDNLTSIPFFQSPNHEAPSIATLLLLLGQEQLLIHLAFDFEFKPCCYISKFKPPSGELFNIRGSGNEVTESFFDGIDQDTAWSGSGRYLENNTQLVHPHTGQRVWAVKSIDGREFTAGIPTSISKPYTNIEISFTTEAHTSDWMFDVWQARSTREDVFSDQGLPIISGSEGLQDILMKHDNLTRASV